MKDEKGNKSPESKPEAKAYTGQAPGLMELSNRAFAKKKGKKRSLVDVLFIPADKFGTGMHQCFYPAAWMAGIDGINVDVTLPTQFDYQKITKADVIILQRQVNADGAKLVASFADQGLATIVDLDDNFWDIPSTHQTRNLWPRERVEVLNRMCEVADGVTCHSNGLEGIVREKFPKLSDKLYRMPALADFSIKPIRKKRNPKKEIRIGWVGAAQHLSDINPAIHACVNVMRKRPNVKLITMGIMDPSIEKLVNWDRRETYAFVPSEEFPHVLSTLDLDIALCPVNDEGFHVGQSARKFIDYSSIKAASILRDAPPYSSEDLGDAPAWWVKGHKVGDWERVINNVIDEGRWSEVGLEAYDYCKERFNGEEGIEKWVDVYREVFNRKMEKIYG